MILCLISLLHLLNYIKNFFNFLVTQDIFKLLTDMIIKLGSVWVWSDKFLDIFVLKKSFISATHGFLDADNICTANKLTAPAFINSHGHFVCMLNGSEVFLLWRVLVTNR